MYHFEEFVVERYFCFFLFFLHVNVFESHMMDLYRSGREQASRTVPVVGVRAVHSNKRDNSAIRKNCTYDVVAEVGLIEKLLTNLENCSYIYVNRVFQDTRLM